MFLVFVGYFMNFLGLDSVFIVFEIFFWSLKVYFIILKKSFNFSIEKEVLYLFLNVKFKFYIICGDVISFFKNFKVIIKCVVREDKD